LISIKCILFLKVMRQIIMLGWYLYRIEQSFLGNEAKAREISLKGRTIDTIFLLL